MARKPRQSSLASQSRRAMSLPNDPRARRSSQGFSDQFKFFIGPGLFQNEFGELQVDFDAVCARCGPGGGGGDPCPPGFRLDPTTGGCVVDPFWCPPGRTYDPITGRCVGLDPPGGWTRETCKAAGGTWQFGNCFFIFDSGTPDCGCGETQKVGAFLSGGRAGSEDTLTWMAL